MKPFLVRATAVIGDIAALVFDTLKEEDSRKCWSDSDILEVVELWDRKKLIEFILKAKNYQ